MATADEQRALQLRNAQDDERFWTSVQEINQATADDHRGVVAGAERTIADAQAQAVNAASNAAAAKERVARIERGEDVPGGLGKPLTREDFLRAGFTARDLRFMDFIADLPADVYDAALTEEHRRSERRRHSSFRAAVRAVMRRAERRE